MVKRNPSMKSIAYVHGFNSTHRSFAYITQNLPKHNVVNINYNSHQRLADSIIEVHKQLPKGQLTLVGHSLGGLISTLLVLNEPERFESLVVISSPLGGSKTAIFMKWMPGYPSILGCITPNAAHIRRIVTSRSGIPTLSIISTEGHLQTTSDLNDSIVAVSSQIALPFGKKVEVKANHFEVLTHEKTVGLIQKHLFGDTHG